MEVHESSEDFTWDQTFMGGNSSNMSSMAFVSPFSILFYRSIFIVIYSIIFSVCIIGNLLVLFVTTTSARMNTRTYFFLSNLAAADLCVGVLCVLPNLMTFLYPSWLLGKVMCKLYHFSGSFSFCASVLLLALIALERYIAVMHPLKARSVFTRCRMHAMQILIWVIAAGYNIPLLLIFDTRTVQDMTFCSIHNFLIIDMQSYYTINFVLWYAIPLFTMCFVYAIIAWTLWHSDSIFGYSSTEISGNGCSTNLVPNSRNNKSKGESSSSGTSSGYCQGGASVHGVGLRAGNSKKEDGVTRTCFCCHGDPDNMSMADEWRTDTRSGSPYASLDRSIACMNTRTTHNNSILVCWPCSGAAYKEGTERHNCQSSRITSNTRMLFTNSPTSYELACLNPNCTHSQRHTYMKHDVFPKHPSNRQHAKLEKKDSVTLTPVARRMSMSLQVLSSRRKVVRLLVVVMITFAVCVLPHHVRLLMNHWDIYPESSFDLGFFPPIAFICLYLNSALNPVLYSLFSQSFRRSLKECLRKLWHRWKTSCSREQFRHWRRERPQFSLKRSTV